MLLLLEQAVDNRINNVDLLSLDIDSLSASLSDDLSQLMSSVDSKTSVMFIIQILNRFLVFILYIVCECQFEYVSAILLLKIMAHKSNSVPFWWLSSFSASRKLAGRHSIVIRNCSWRVGSKTTCCPRSTILSDCKGFESSN